MGDTTPQGLAPRGLALLPHGEGPGQSSSFTMSSEQVAARESHRLAAGAGSSAAT